MYKLALTITSFGQVICLASSSQTVLTLLVKIVYPCPLPILIHCLFLFTLKSNFQLFISIVCSCSLLSRTFSQNFQNHLNRQILTFFDYSFNFLESRILDIFIAFLKSFTIGSQMLSLHLHLHRNSSQTLLL